MSNLEIHPQSASMTAGQTQQFEASQNGQPVKPTWSLQPSPRKAGSNGEVQNSGVYSAPKGIFRNRKIVVVAQMTDGSSGSAVVELVPLSFWTTFVGAYLLGSLVILLVAITVGWRALCPSCHPERVRVSPPVVTLGPSQSQLFTANVPVQWKGSHLSTDGLYTTPSASKAGKAQLVAKQGGRPQTPAAADVFLSTTGSLALQPSQATVTTGGSLDLTAVADPLPAADTVVHWLSPPLGTLTPTSATGPGSATARFTVPASAVDRPTTLQIVARIDEATPRLAGAWVTVRPASLLTGICEDGDSFNVGGLLLLLALMGALGAIIHAISSFTTFVGNREFLTSWVWWYVFKPFLGGLVALVVFLVFRAGFGAGSFSLDAADCLKSAAFAALIGLFAEQATLKLKDIFDSLFTPRTDPRKDAAGGAKATAPILISLDPPSVVAGQKIASLTLHGSGFAAECQVKLGTSTPRKPTSVTSTQLVVPLTAEDIKGPTSLPVIVYNKPPEDSPSNTVKLEVTAAVPADEKKSPPG
jgi:hypothetical protein